MLLVSRSARIAYAALYALLGSVVTVLGVLRLASVALVKLILELVIVYTHPSLDIDTGTGIDRYRDGYIDIGTATDISIQI